jgi:hypothetical protein
VKRLPALRPVVGNLGGRDVDQRVACRGPEVGQRGQLSGRAVEDELDRVAVLALLQPGGRELEQLYEHRLGVGARDADRQPDHARSLVLADEVR